MKKIKKITRHLVKILFISTLALALLNMPGCGALKFSGADQPYAPPTPKPTKQKNLALVLGGGGAKGMAHIGVIEELERAGIVPDVIIGCSAGAIVGGLYAANPDITALKTLLLSGKESDILNMTIQDWPYSVYDNNKLAGYLKQHLKQKKFADMKIPLIVTATNLEFGNVTVFGEGEVITPIVASAALPGAFAPVKIADQYFIDCGASDPIPVRVARDLGYKTVVAVNIAEQLPETSPNHMLGVVKRSIEIAYVNQCKYSLEGADVIIDFKFKNIGMFTDKFNYYLYEAGKDGAKPAIPLIKTVLAQNSTTKK